MKAKRRLRQIPSLVPILSVLRHYPMHWLGKDAVAGLTACIVMIPSVLAYAELVHLPPITGIYAAIMACVGYAVFSSSRHVVAGPDAAIGLLAGSAILPLAGEDPARIAVLAAELAVFSGLILLAASQLKLGIIADLLSRPVLVGYLNGASLVLIATQLGKLFGLKTQGEEFFPLVFSVVERLLETHWPTFGLGVFFIVLLVALARWLPRVPAALVVSAVAVACAWLLDLEQHGVSLVGRVEPGMPSIELFRPRWSDVAALAPAAVAIAFLAFSDGILLAQTFAEKNGYEVDANQELLALGVANVMASAAQGFPVSASQSRSSVVDALGAKSQVAQLVAAGGLVLFLLFFTPLLALMPKAALGAILIVTAFGMLETASLRMLLRIDRSEFAIAVGVTLIILLTGVVPGIIAGLLLSLIDVLYEISRPRDAILRRLSSDGKFHDCLDPDEGESVPGLIVYRLYAPLIFANARYVTARIRELVDQANGLECLVIDAQAISDLDVTAAQRFTELYQELTELGVEIKIADSPRPFREQLIKVGLSAKVGSEHFYVSVKKAVESFERRKALDAGEISGPPSSSTIDAY
ncbi:MAG: SulP family inorganic anion transporter [Propionivibrio sp.]